MAKAKAIRIRRKADAPPLPLGCRWCGHAPYAHEAHSLPHRREHMWEQPTPAQAHARMRTRRRLGLCGPMPAAMPSRPLKAHPPAMPSQARPGRHTRPATAAYGRGRPPDAATPSRHEPHRQGVPA